MFHKNIYRGCNGNTRLSNTWQLWSHRLFFFSFLFFVFFFLFCFFFHLLYVKNFAIRGWLVQRMLLLVSVFFFFESLQIDFFLTCVGKRNVFFFFKQIFLGGRNFNFHYLLMWNVFQLYFIWNKCFVEHISTGFKNDSKDFEWE